MKIVCFILILLFIIVQSSIEVELPDHITPSCKFVQWINDFPQGSHLLVLSSSLLTNQSMEGIYIAQLPTNLKQKTYIPDESFIKNLQEYQKNGVLGVVALDPETIYEPGIAVLSFYYGFRFPTNFSLPIGIISQDCFQKTVGPFPNGVNVTVFGWDNNGWTSFLFSPGYYVWFVSLALFFVFNMGFALYKLVKVYFLFKKTITIGLISLTLEFFANLIRFLQMVFVPYLNTFNIPDLLLLITLSQPFSLSSSFLLIFFWLDLTSKSLYQGNLLSVMKIPTIVTITLLFITEICVDVLRVSTDFSSDSGNILVGIYSFIHTLVAIFYFYAAYKIFKLQKDFSKVKARLMKRITTQVVFCGIAILWVTLMILCSAIQGLFSTPVGSFISNYMLWFSFFPQSLLQIMVFGNNETKDTSNGKTSNVAE